MKVRNLLLAGLAVAAMTACSNENDEIVDNDNQPTTSEKANMQINFTFANSGTRAVKGDGTDAGETFEWESADITVLLEYARGTKQVVVEGLDLVKEPNQNSGVAQYTTNSFQVNASPEGEVTIYAFVNPSKALTEKLKAGEKASIDLSKVLVNKIASLPADLNYLIGKDEAAENDGKKGRFLMTGTATNQTLTAGETTTADITVSRVVAKLDEMTDADHVYSISENSELMNKNAIGIKITHHSYSNLSDDSYALKGNASIASYLQPYISQGNPATYESYEWIGAQATYCYENFTPATPTRVHYVGKVLFDDEEIDNDFYVWAKVEGKEIIKTAYKNWAELQEVVTIPDKYKEDDTVLKDAYGVQRYKSGLCYYEAEILTAASEKAEIIRNNWYKLTVKSINDLGTPDPVIPTPDKKAYLVVSANVEPWTINVNDVEL